MSTGKQGKKEKKERQEARRFVCDLENPRKC